MSQNFDPNAFFDAYYRSSKFSERFIEAAFTGLPLTPMSPKKRISATDDLLFDVLDRLTEPEALKKIRIEKQLSEAQATRQLQKQADEAASAQKALEEKNARMEVVRQRGERQRQARPAREAARKAKKQKRIAARAKAVVSNPGEVLSNPVEVLSNPREVLSNPITRAAHFHPTPGIALLHARPVISAAPASAPLGPINLLPTSRLGKQVALGLGAAVLGVFAGLRFGKTDLVQPQQPQGPSAEAMQIRDSLQRDG